MKAVPFQFRVTKFNPAHRNAQGAYLIDEWTSRADIGRAFNGIVLTEEAYQSIEQSYVQAALAYLIEARVGQLKVVGLENKRKSDNAPTEGEAFSVENLGLVLPGLLRERYWCRLESDRAFVHVGYDYYMYLGVPILCPRAELVAVQSGLFVEAFRSPYSKNEA